MRTFLIPALLLLGCAAPARSFEERLLDTIPEGFTGRSYRFSREGRVVAYVRLRGTEEDRVVVNRIAGKPLSLI